MERVKVNGTSVSVGVGLVDNNGGGSQEMVVASEADYSFATHLREDVGMDTSVS